MVHLDGKIISESSDGRRSFGKNEREFGEAVAAAAHPSSFAIRRNTPAAAAAAGGNFSSKNSSKSTISPCIIHPSPALHLHASSHLNPLQNSLQNHLQTPFQIPSIRIWPSISPICPHPANHFSALPCWSIDGTNPPSALQKTATMSTEELRPIFEDNESRQKSLTSTEEGGDGMEQCRRENGLSAFPTALNFVKGMLGPGCLSIPLIFRQSGWLAGLFLVFLFGFVSTKCMLQLVNCSQHLSKKKRHQHLDYGDVAFEACAQSFSRLRPYKGLARIAVNASIASLQVGICSVSVVFLAAHIKEISEELFSFNLSQQQWILVIAIPLILINFIRTLHKIVFLSIIGSFLMLTALAIIFQHLIRAKHVPLANLPPFTNLNGIISASGAVLYAYEGQAMVLPLENKLRVPSQMGGPCGILAWSMSFVSLIYALCGFAGYATYGQKVEGSIALNLPSGEILFTSVRLMLTLVVFFGFVMQQYLIVEMIWPKLAKMLGNNSNTNKMFAGEMAFRASLVILAVAIAFAVPNLERIIPLVGMSAGMLLAIVFPSFLDTLTFLPAEIEQRNWDKIVLRIIQNGILAIIGLFSLIGGVEANLMELIKPKG